MATFANLTVVGHLTADPLFIAATDEKPAFARMRVMHNPWGKRKDQTEYPPIAVNVIYSGKIAETVGSYAKKGTQVLVSGRLTENTPALDKAGNEVRTKGGELIINMSMQGQDFILLGSKESNGKSNGTAAPVTEEAVPF